MSWDVIIINSTEKLSIEQIMEDSIIPSFGHLSEIQNKISSLYPNTDWTDPSYACINNGIYEGNISLGNGELLNGTFMLHVYGGSNPLIFIISLCQKFNWTAYDTTASEYIDLDNPSDKGWIEFQKFRLKATDQLSVTNLKDSWANKR